MLFFVFDWAIFCVGSGACPSTLVRQSWYCVFLCKYLSNLFLPYPHTHPQKETFNLYLPLPIPFQIIDVLFFTMVRHMPAPLVRQIEWLELLLCIVV